MSKKTWRAGLMLGALLAALGIAWAQGALPGGTLTVNGQPGQAPVIQVNGRSYVDVEALARLANASLAFNGNQIILSLPASGGSTPTAAASGAPASSEFSKEFMRAGIEEMSAVREWRSALLSAVQQGYPVTEEWMAAYQGQAATNLRLAFVAASTDSDRSAFQLLRNEFDKMAKLSSQVVAARKNMTYLAPDALKDDPLNQQILACARALQSMAASGAFQDDGSCH